MRLLTWKSTGLFDMSYNELLNSDIKKLSNVIYMFQNKFNNKKYIGQTSKTLSDRVAMHIWQSKNQSSYFHNALFKYGIENFDIQVIDICSNKQQLNEKEKYWINHFSSNNKELGYNLTSGGTSYTHVPVFKKDSIETKQKKAESAKKKWQDPEYRKRYKQSRKEYIKVAQLDLNGTLRTVYPSMTDAEKFLFGKKNGRLRTKLIINQMDYYICNGSIWQLYDKYIN